MGLNMLLFSGGVQLFENSPALAGAGAAGGTYGGTTAVLGGNAGAAAGSPAAAVNPAAAAGQMALYNQLAGGLAAIETLLGHLNKEEAARQQKVLEQARERFQELAEAEEKYISANIKSRAEALAAVEAMMRELDLTQSQYEAIRDALIAQNVISAAAGQAYAGTWEDLLYGDMAEYGVGYAPVLGNIYFAKKRKEAAASQADTSVNGSVSQKDPDDNEDGDESTADFEKRISRLSPEERVAAVKEKARQVAKDKGLIKDSRLSRLNGRDIYKDPKTGEYYSVDTQHGRFEHLNKRGKHLGEVDFDFNSTKPADTSGGHDIRIK